MIEILHQPGFLGTGANFAADMTLVIAILVAVIFSVGFYFARRGQIAEKNGQPGKQWYLYHRICQTTAGTINAILVFWLMVLPFRDFVIRDPDSLPAIAHWITALHGLVGSVALSFGLFVILRANGLMIKPLRFKNYRLFMRISFTLYMVATVLGLFVYFTWFVSNPTPPTYGLAHLWLMM